MVIIVGNGYGNMSSNPGQSGLFFFFSHSSNTLWKGMNPIILPPAMGKQTDFLGLGRATSLGEGKLFQTC